jgi:hypothetical protein
MKIEFEISAGLVNTVGPCVEIWLDQNLINDITLEKHNNIIINIDNSLNNIIKFVHKNKSDNDTVVVDNQIVEDKYLAIEKVWVDDILLPNFFNYTKCEVFPPKSFLDHNKSYNIKQSNNLYFNGNLYYEFKKDFFIWLHNYYQIADQKYIADHSDPDAEQKFFGYNQESSAEQELKQILESRGYRIAY